MIGNKIIIGETAMVGWVNSMETHYVELGYKKIRQGERFEVKIDHLPSSSTASILVACPVCYEVRRTKLNKLLNRHSVCRSCSGISDISGEKFGRLIAVSPTFVNDRYHKVRWYCICECGKDTYARTDGLIDGSIASCGCLHTEYLAARTGINHPRWIPPEERISTGGRKGHAHWKQLVHERDEYKCVICGNSGKIAAHHLDCYALHRELANEISNGVTLCKSCHNDFHYRFMGWVCRPCTREDFQRYVLSRQF